MERIKELSRWLKKQVNFLLENLDHLGTWKKLDDNYCIVVLWEEGWGKELRDDVIQHPNDPNYGLCAGIKIYSADESLDYWRYPWNNESGDLYTESIGIAPNEDFEELAAALLDDFKYLEGTVPEEDGSINLDRPAPNQGVILVDDSPEVEEELVEADDVEGGPQAEEDITTEFDTFSKFESTVDSIVSKMFSLMTDEGIEYSEDHPAFVSKMINHFIDIEVPNATRKERYYLYKQIRQYL